MTAFTVTDNLLHELVTGSHAEGTTRLAVAAAIEHDERTLLIAVINDDFEPAWELPADLVLPGETLLEGLDRTVAITTGLGITDVTGYAGHHDRFIDGDITRTFVFTVTADDPDRICRWAKIGHRWTSKPGTGCVILGDLQRCPTDPAIASSTTPPSPTNTPPSTPTRRS
jgi:ADP-ribose pyrophosphatase YjhB (NUDIX family)